MGNVLHSANVTIKSVNNPSGSARSRYFLDQLHDYQVFKKSLLLSYFVQTGFFITGLVLCPMASLGISDAEC
jgi:hypothetical protein